jgi:prephenate dehydrogenase
MAGREMTGFDAADAGLFLGRAWVITEAVGGGDPEAVRRLALASGARPVPMPAAEHDRAVAAISHLPLVLSAALVEAMAARPDWPAAEPLAAGGWSSVTRLARGDVEMGTGIAVTNAAAIAADLRDLRMVLDGWLANLEGDPADEAAIRARLASARAVLIEEEA